MKDFESERYRQLWESDEHWQIRKEFLETYCNDFEEDRLLCLAQIYSNVELMQCRYPAAIMQQIHELGKDLTGCTHREDTSVKFVKEGGKDIAKPSLYSSSTQNTLPADPKTKSSKELLLTQPKIQNSDIKASDIILTKELVTVEEIKFLEKLWTKVSANTTNDSCLVGTVCNSSIKLGVQPFFKIEMEPNCSPQEISFKCDFYIKNTLISSASGPSKKKARLECVKIGMDKIKKFSNISNALKRKKSEECSESSSKVKKICNNKNGEEENASEMLKQEEKLPQFIDDVANSVKASFPESIPGIQFQEPMELLKQKFLERHFHKRFIILYYDDHDVDLPVKVLSSSAQFCRICLTYEYEYPGLLGSNCKALALLDGEVCGIGTAPLKSDAKTAAAKEALEFLKTFVYTVKVNDEAQGFVITREQLVDINTPDQPSVSSTFGQPKAISETSVGCKMLRNMGWTGGSIGKIGSTGIIEPISAEKTQVFREGLGFANQEDIKPMIEHRIRNKLINNKKWVKEQFGDFPSKCESLIKDYAYADTENDLIFSNEFSKEERHIIHKIAIKFNLKNASKGGKGDNRHVVLSHRYSSEELLDYLIRVGGSTFKYELIEPPQFTR